jgi:uncharacterized C2H2 Zn-finger protein
MHKTLFFVAAVLVCSTASTFAGTGYTMTCGECGYSSEVNIGGGMMFEQITGFCVETGKFTYLTWKRDTKKPEPAAKIWDSATGKTIELYKCPKSGKLFMPLNLKEDDWDSAGFEHCPKCGKPAFKVDKDKGIIAYD